MNFIFWYCCDDFFAKLLNLPALGEIPWYYTLCLTLLFSNTNIVVKDGKNK